VLNYVLHKVSEAFWCCLPSLGKDLLSAIAAGTMIPIQMLRLLFGAWVSPQNKLSSLKLSCSSVVVDSSACTRLNWCAGAGAAPKLLLVTGLPPEVSENPTEADDKSVLCPRLAGFVAFESLDDLSKKNLASKVFCFWRLVIVVVATL
jgi:hypothetical protein